MLFCKIIQSCLRFIKPVYALKHLEHSVTLIHSYPGSDRLFLTGPCFLQIQSTSEDNSNIQVLKKINLSDTILYLSSKYFFSFVTITFLIARYIKDIRNSQFPVVWSTLGPEFDVPVGPRPRIHWSCTRLEEIGFTTSKMLEHGLLSSNVHSNVPCPCFKVKILMSNKKTFQWDAYRPLANRIPLYPKSHVRGGYTHFPEVSCLADGYPSTP